LKLRPLDHWLIHDSSNISTMGASDNEEAIIRCGTTKGDITLHLIREWSPNGYDRAVELYERHFYDGSHFYRAVPKFLVQFGISYTKDKELQSFARKTIQDDPKHDPPIEFHPGTISYAGSGPNSRGSQMFFSYGSAGSLGRELWETPIGKVIEGMDAAEQFYSYGDMPPWGKGPVQGKIYNGPQYIEENFPLIDRFLKCTVERRESSAAGVAVNAERDDGDDIIANAEVDDFQVVEVHDPLKKTLLPSDHIQDMEHSSLDKEPKRRLVRSGLQNPLENSANSQTFIFPAAVVLVLVILFCSFRGRRKDSAKMN